jgi:L-iditol 2-dehydrogenase
MRAVRLARVGVVSVASVPEPVAGPGELLLRVDAAGICGSDRHLVSGEYPAAPPVTLGHELEGTVVATGAGCTVPLGARVAVDPNIPCRQCRYCDLGLVALCDHLRAIGVDVDGGLAELASVPGAQAHLLPDGLPLGYGALCEPLACCLRAIDHSGLGPGSTAAVLGGGVIGQMLSQLARLAGARVVLVTRQLRRRELAIALGASATVDPASRDVVEAVSGPQGWAPGGVDVAFEAAGVAGTFGEALAVARRGGRVVVVGAAPSSLTVPVSPFDIFARELQVVGSHLNPFTHGRAVALAASGQLDLSALVTATVSLSEVPELLGRGPATGEVKVQVRPA